MPQLANIRATPIDGYPTLTSDAQAQTEQVLHARLLSARANVTPSSPSQASAPREGISSITSEEWQPVLDRNSHLQFLLRNLVQGFPARYTSQDASQPWLIFWTLQGFSILGVGLDERTKRRAIDTLLALQHPTGGFSGGPGQFPHLLPTYAATCALAIVGDGGENGGWKQIDREAMYDFFMTLKQPDGSFLVSHDAEVDVRGTYCLLLTATLLNIMTPELLQGVPAFIAGCQTYEGGFANSRHGEWGLNDPFAPTPPLGEAHGGYTYCATASWALLQPYLRVYYSPSPTLLSPSFCTTKSNNNIQTPHINLPLLLYHVVSLQGSAIELGGFRGRTNKLVDGCYSWWVGGAVAIVEGLIHAGKVLSGKAESEAVTEKMEDVDGDSWDDVDDALFNREALQEYVLIAAQHSAGGLVDKPPKSPDAYHTLYCLSGLSSAQHRVLPSNDKRTDLLKGWSNNAPLPDEVQKSSGEKLRELQKETYISMLSWAEEEGTGKYVGGAQNRVNATHPLANLTATHTENIMAYFYEQKPLPPRAYGSAGRAKQPGSK